MGSVTHRERDSEIDLARNCARHIVEAFGFYNAEFRVITRPTPALRPPAAAGRMFR